MALKYFSNTLTQEEEEMRLSSVFNKNFWIIRGYSEKEAIDKVSKIQKNNSRKKFKKYTKEERKKFSTTKIEYWLNKGFSEEEAKNKLSERQKTFSLDICVKKYGDVEGYLVWKRRQNKWKNTLNNNARIDEINLSKDSSSFFWAIKKCNGDFEAASKLYKKRSAQHAVDMYSWAIEKANGDIDEARKIYTKRIKNLLTSKNKWVSKESIKFLLPLYIFCTDNGIKDYEIKWKENEYYIFNDRKIYFYDFTIIPLKLIIEYHGILFHPKSIDDKNFKLIMNEKYTVEELFKKDRHKKETAIKNGFDFYEVWSDETDGFISKMKNVITEKIELLNYEKNNHNIK